MIKISKKQKELIEGNILAFATCDLRGKPNVIAVSFCRVVDKDKILITDNFMNKTRKNLIENSRVAISVWGEDGNEGYQFKGKADYLTSGKWKKIVDKDPNNKGLAHKAAVLVTVEEIWDLANPKLLAER